MMRGMGACLAVVMLLPSLPAAAAPAELSAIASDPLAPLPDSAPEISPQTRIILDWVLASRDNGEYPFMIVDKQAAEVVVFSQAGELLGRTPALLGSAKGDSSEPGIGERELRNIPPADRTTPAGRFVAKLGFASGKKQVLWVDWATAVSMHPVITGNARERRLQRLSSPTQDDNRITYGCINLPTRFYKEIVAPLVADTAAIVYILPEERSLAEVFWGDLRR